MKPLLVSILLFLLIPLLGYGQSAFDLQVDAPTVGKRSPDFKFYTLTPSGIQQDSLSAYRGQVVVLEFWATHCRPCIPAMDHLEIMEAGFPKQMKVLEITDESREAIDRFLDKHPTGSTVVWDYDQNLNKNFYHHFIPHTVLIDPQGVVRAFTSPDQVSGQVIRQLLAGQNISIKPKHEYDPEAKPLNSDLAKALDAIANATEPEKIIVPKQVQKDHKTLLVMLSGHRANTETQIIRESDQQVSFINCPLTLMYQTLFGMDNSRMILEILPEHLPKYSFSDENSYCLDLTVPDFLKKSLLEFGQQQLESYFDLRAKKEIRNTEVFCIEKSDNQALLLKNDGSYSPKRMGTLGELMSYLERSPTTQGLPIVNGTELATDTPIDTEWFMNYNDSIENKLLSLGFKKVIKKVDLEVLVLFEKAEVK